MSLFVITPTYERLVKVDRQPRLKYLKRLADTLKAAENYVDIHWVIVEDGSKTSPSVAGLVDKCQAKGGLQVTYVACGPSNIYGNLQRARGLEIVLQKSFPELCDGSRVDDGKTLRGGGYIYFADDDNLYHPELFDALVARARRWQQKEIRREKLQENPKDFIPPVLMFSVGNLGPKGVERPLVSQFDANQIVGFDCGWLERSYPVDNAGYAVHTRHIELQHPTCQLFGWFSMSRYRTSKELHAGKKEMRQLEELRQYAALQVTSPGEASEGAVLPSLGPPEMLRPFCNPRFLRFPQLEYGGESEFLESLLGSERDLSKLRGVDLCNVHVAHDIPLSQREIPQLPIDNIPLTAIGHRVLVPIAAWKYEAVD